MTKEEIKKGTREMIEFIYGMIVGWVCHALWIFMIRPILRKAQEK